MRYIFLVFAFLLLLVFCPQSWSSLPSANTSKYDKFVNLALKFAGMKEEKQNNRSIWIDKFNKNSKVALGSPYCTSFICFIADSVNLSQSDKLIFKKSALAKGFKGKKEKTAAKVLAKLEKVEKADIVIWTKGKTMFGHAGIAIEDWKNSQGMTIQANTSGQGENRDGDGIFIKSAKIQPFSYFRIIRFWKL